MLSVSFKLVELEGFPSFPLVPPYSGKAPSGAVGKSLLTFDRTPPHAQVMLPTMNRPLLSVVYAPRVFPLVDYSKRLADPVLGSLLLAFIARPIESLFHYIPCPVAAASLGAYRSLFVYAFDARPLMKETAVLISCPAWRGYGSLLPYNAFGI